MHLLVAFAPLALASASLPPPATPAIASERQPVYAPPPPWVEIVPIPSPGSASGASPPASETLLFNEQVRLDEGADETFVETAVRFNAPAGLAGVGSLTQTWNPLTQSLTIHHLRVLRGSQTIDLLANGKRFTVLRRETNLEASMIDGALTATFQPEGLQVGDVLDVAFTLKRHDPAMGGYSEGGWALAHRGVVNRLVTRASWSAQRPIRMWKTDDLPSLAVKTADGWSSVGYDLQDAVSVQPPEGAPLRDQVFGAVQFSSFKDWPEFSKAVYAIFDPPTKIAPASPVKAEIDRLAAENRNPKARALAALRLVEDKVRYLYVALDAGGYVPAPADQTWARRFGDCKGKTVLLLAMLRGLGVEAEPVLVSSAGGDGLDQRLPQMADFDHVLVRAIVGGRAYWLDATRLDDANLDILRTPNLHWALPLRPSGASLEPLHPDPLTEPDDDKRLDVDLRAGIDHPAKTHMERILKGDAALGMSILLKQASPADADRALRKIFEADLDWVKVDKTSFKYEPATGVGLMTMDGSGLAPFSSNGSGESWLVDLSHLAWDADFRRASPYHAGAPYAVAYPSYSRAIVRVALPGAGFQVANGSPLSQTIAGQAYTRSASVAGDRMVMTASVHAISPEFPAVDAAAAQRTLQELAEHDVLLESKGPAADAKLSVVGPSEVPPTPPSTAAQAAKVDFLERDYERAEAEFTRAMAANPTAAELVYGRGAARLARGHDGPAKSDFEAALKLNPKDEFALFALGRLALRQGDPSGAAARFKTASEAAVNPHAMVGRIAASYDQTGHPAEAAPYYEVFAAGEMDVGKRGRDLNVACWARARSGVGLPQARADCDQAVITSLDIPSALDSRGLVELKMRAFDRSIADYDKALAARPNIATSVYGRGLAKLRLGKRDEGEKGLAEARRLDPKIDSRFAEWGERP